MNKLLIIILVSTLLFSCSNTKETSSSSSTLPPPMTSNVETKSFNGVEYQCEIKMIHNAMPGTSSKEKKLYAIVELQPTKGTFKDNWKIERFEFDEKNYSKFDENSFSGKGQINYKNVVREIATDVEKKNVKVQFINEKNEILDFEIKNVSIQTVH